MKKGGKELNQYFENPDILTLASITKNEEIDLSQALFCVVPHEDNEDYLGSFQFYNHYFYVDLGENKPISDELI